jgi:predicted nuclease of predicted toxin-antitoxin system
VKFLVDNQLPAALARFLNSRGHDAEHVLDLQMDEADDPDVWNHAVSEGRALVSKDEDFLHLANRPGAFGTFVWVRLGNCRKQALLAAFDRALPAIVTALEEGHRVIEVR